VPSTRPGPPRRWSSRSSSDRAFFTEPTCELPRGAVAESNRTHTKKLRARLDDLYDRLERDAANPPPVRSSDPNDDYLIALAAEQSTVLVTGDRHLLAVAGSFPIHEPVDFLAMLARPAS
jgi:predicted nucleic acid-binding protein